MEQATGTGWSLRRLRERVLRVASRVVRHGRRLTFVIAQDAAPIGSVCGASLRRSTGRQAEASGGTPIGSRALCYGPYHVRPIRSAPGRIATRGRSRSADLSTSAGIRSRRQQNVRVSRSARDPPRILNSANSRAEARISRVHRGKHELGWRDGKR